jgi:hypothetical protein
MLFGDTSRTINEIWYLLRSLRGVAQLVARVFWEHEVAGSNPVAPTKNLTSVFEILQKMLLLEVLDWPHFYF